MALEDQIPNRVVAPDECVVSRQTVLIAASFVEKYATELFANAPDDANVALAYAKELTEAAGPKP